MSDTPRTDRQVFGKKVMMHEMVHADFARELERETEELEQEYAKLEREVAGLRKDKERLDWLLSNGGTIYTNRGKGYISLSGNEDYRADIDEAMGDAG